MGIATSSRLDHVQALRGLAAMLVLFSHLLPIEAKTAAHPILPDSAAFGMMGVDLFFVISGFIMVYVTRDWDGGQRHSRAGEFLFARAARIYPLYWIVSAALLLVWLIRPDLVFSSSPNEPQFLNSVFLIPAYAYPMLEMGWTLVFEMGFYLVFALLLFLPAKIRPLGLLAWGTAIALGMTMGVQHRGAILWHLFNPLTFEFLAGAVTALIFMRWRAPLWLARTLIALGCAGLFIWFLLGGVFTFEDGWTRVLRFTAPSCALLLGAAWLDRHGRNAWHPAVWLGDISYSLYLTHLLSLSLAAKIWVWAGLSGAPSGLLLTALTGFAIIVAGFAYNWIETPILKGTKRLRRRWFVE